mmetsp:Transcript_3355/g.12749  ORF Transcript_3355/g.12749 Transcript_3355/m.12749 type:complete len:559 (-) Transcript_3355:170-1846(-)
MSSQSSHSSPQQTLRNLSQHLYSLLGPHSSDKLCLLNEKTKKLSQDSSKTQYSALENHFLITNDGATLLSTLPLCGPVNDTIILLSQIQDELIGDGTTSVVLLCDAIMHEMKQMASLLKVEQCQRKLFVKMQELTWKLAQTMISDVQEEFDTVRHIPIILNTCLSSKIVHGTVIEKLLEDLFSHSDGPTIQSRNQMKVMSRIGKSMEHSYTFRGAFIERVWPSRIRRRGFVQPSAKASMAQSSTSSHDTDPPPTFNPDGSISNARVLVCRLEILASFRVVGASLNAFSAEQGFDMMHFESQQTINIVHRIIDSGANVVFQSGRVSSEAKQLMEQHGIVVVDGCQIREINEIAQSCGSRVVRHISANPSTSIPLGLVKRIGPHALHDEQLIKVEADNTYCVVLQAPTFSMAAEVERSLHDALCIVFKSLESGAVVPGAGALYIELSHRLRNHALSQAKDEILIAEAMARALENIPAILARNAGISVVDTLNTLREDHRNAKWFSALVNGKCGSDGRLAMEPSSLFLNVLRGAMRCASILMFEELRPNEDRVNVRDLGLM